MEKDQSLTGLFQKQKNSLAIRIWHWLTFTGFAASLMTVLLGSTLFKTDANFKTVMLVAAHNGTSLTRDQAMHVAHAFSDKIWNMHKIIGYTLCFLFLSRIIIEIFQEKDEKLLTRIQTALRLGRSDKDGTAERDLYVFVKRGYLIFYLLFLIMALTGLVMAFDELDFLKPLQKTANSVHLFIQYGIYGYIVLHIGGVVYADLHKNKGIISGMIHGGRI